MIVDMGVNSLQRDPGAVPRDRSAQKDSLLASPETAGPVSLLGRNLKVELLYLFQESSQMVADPLKNSIALLYTGAQRVANGGGIRVLVVKHRNEDVLGTLEHDSVGAVFFEKAGPIHLGAWARSALARSIKIDPSYIPFSFR